MKAGFVGVGQMGAPMAANLASSQKVIAYCRKDSDRRSLEASGVIVTENLQSVAETDVIFLPDYSY